MNIVLLHPHDIFDAREPWTIRIESLAIEFARKGHEVTLIHFINETSIEKYTRHKAGFKIVSLRRHGGVRLFCKNMQDILAEIKHADIIHFQKCFHYVCLPALCGSLLYGKAVHYDWDDLEEAIYQASHHPHNWFIHFFIKTFERVIPLIVDTISVASVALREKCLRWGIPAYKVYTAPVGADLEKFGPHIAGDPFRKRFKPNDKVVVYLGQLNGAQYTHLFIEAVQLLKETYDHVHYIIVGAGTKFKELQDRAHQLGVGDGIIFAGAVPHDKVPLYLAASDIAVACFEDNEITRCKSPLKVVEYLAAGKAIVASAVGEVKTMLNGCGMLVEPGSARALADGIRELLEHEEKISILGMLARERAEKLYNWEHTARTLLDAYGVAIHYARYGTTSVHPDELVPLAAPSEEEVAL